LVRPIKKYTPKEVLLAMKKIIKLYTRNRII
jgi:hypothetical protein